jgi:hypothetical protein
LQSTDIPVELYPLGFVVGMGLVGGLAASVRNCELSTDSPPGWRFIVISITPTFADALQS